MRCGENFILITFQFFCWKSSQKLSFNFLHVVSQGMGQLVLRDFQSPGTATLPSRAGKHLREAGHCLGISCTCSPQRRLSLER